MKDLKVRAGYHSRIDWVPLNLIDVLPNAQRKFDPAQAKDIADNFDPDLLGLPLLVARRDRFLCADGQHRCAATRMAMGKEQKIQCEIITDDGIDAAEIARLFRGRNHNRQVRPLDKFLTGVTSKDPQCLAINKIVVEHGLVVAKATGDGCIRAVAMLQQIYRKDQAGDLLRRTLEQILDCWGKDKDGLQAEVIQGIALVLQRYGKELANEDVARKLSAVTPLSLIGRGRAYKDSVRCGTGEAMARVIIAQYNSGRSRNRLPDWGTKAATNGTAPKRAAIKQLELPA